MAIDPSSISIIIPAKDTESDALKALCTQIEPLGCEIIIESSGNRAQAQNTGAAIAKGRYLWFLHADSILPPDAFPMLQKAIDTTPRELLFFNLAFSSDDSKLKFNAFGANFRARVFGLPFGDQGFCIAKDIFQRVGGVPKNEPIGEDHLFVWKLKRIGVKAIPIETTLTTAADKYIQNGWLKQTLRNQIIWITQALQQIFYPNPPKKQAVLAVFAKTPGLVPVKTRLAKTIGQPASEKLYQLSIDAIKTTLSKLDCDVVWVLAKENEAMSAIWNDCEIVISGSGDLGEQQHKIYDMLQEDYTQVALIGSDCPQMSASFIQDAFLKLKNHDYVIAPATDGGYTLIAGNKPIHVSAWTTTKYSQPDTALQLQSKLEGRIATLPTLTDMDEKEDLQKILSEMPSPLNDAQARFVSIIEKNLKKEAN